MTAKEALQRMINVICNECSNCVCEGGNEKCFWFNLYKKVETALNRLEELEKENVLLRENNRSLEELMKRPELVIVKENIQLQRDNDLLLINECSARQENKELKEVLKIIKEKGVRELSVVADLCNWDWNEYVKLPCSKLYTKTEFNLLKEYLG